MIASCSTSITSFPFAVPVADVDGSWVACEAAAVDVPSPIWCGNLNVTWFLGAEGGRAGTMANNGGEFENGSGSIA